MEVRDPTILLFLPVHARRWASLMPGKSSLLRYNCRRFNNRRVRLPLAGTRFEEEHDSKIRQRSASVVELIQPIRVSVELREPTISFFLPVHARKSASLMPGKSSLLRYNCRRFNNRRVRLPLAGMRFLEERDSKIRQRSASVV